MGQTVNNINLSISHNFTKMAASCAEHSQKRFKSWDIFIRIQKRQVIQAPGQFSQLSSNVPAHLIQPKPARVKKKPNPCTLALTRVPCQRHVAGQDNLFLLAFVKPVHFYSLILKLDYFLNIFNKISLFLL
jgi:hypothetical protein